MKKTGKKFLSVLLAVMMVFTVLTPAAFAEEVAGPEPEEPVREYIYEVCPVTGFRVEINTSNAQLQEKLAADYPTVKVKGSQNGEHTVPVIWNVEDSSYDGSQNQIYTITGELNLSDYPYLFNVDNLKAWIKVAVGSAEIRHITNAEAELSDQEVPYGTPWSQVDLPSKANVFLDGGEESVEASLFWSDYYPNYIGEQRLVARLSLPDSMDCSENWCWAVTVTVLPPEGIQSISAYELTYSLPGEERGHYAEKQFATVVLSDGTEHQVPLSWQSRSYSKDESVLYRKSVLHIPCDRIYGTVVLSGIDGFKNIATPMAISEKVGVRDETQRELISVSLNNSNVQEYSKGYLKEDILASRSYDTADVEVSSGDKIISTYLKIIWDSDNFEFDGNTPGEYTLYGDVNLSQTDIQNPSNIRAEVKIKINDIPVFLLSRPRYKDYYVDISVDSGTSKPEIVDMLNSKYSMIKVGTSWGNTGTSLPVIWETDDFEYQGEDGVYFVKGNYDTTGRSVYLAGGEKTTARITVGDALKKVFRVEYPSGLSQTVSYGTPLEDLNLPDQITVYWEKAPEEPVTLAVQWSEYFPTLVGKQELRAEIAYPNWVDYTSCSFTAQITVEPPEGVTSVSGSDAHLIPRCSKLEDIEKLLSCGGYLDEKSTIVFANGEAGELPIVWENQPVPSYTKFDNGKITNQFYPGYHGYYNVRGEVCLSSLPGFEGVPNATVIYSFQEGWDRNNNQVFSVDSVQDLHVERGTTAAQVQTMLDEQYPELRIYIDAELFPTEKVCPVTWNVADSNYNRFIEGSYTVFGVIDLTGADAMMELGEIRARAQVIVGDGGIPIVSVAKVEPVSFTGMAHVAAVKPMLEEERPDVEVTLTDGSKITLPVIWDIREFADYTGEDGNYTIKGTLDLSGHPEISNPNGLYAELKGSRFGYVPVKEKAELEDLEVGYGTSLENVRRLVREKYPQIQVVLKNDETLMVPIVWDNDPENYNPKKPGRYFFTSGALDFSQTPYYAITGERVGVGLILRSDVTFAFGVDFGSKKLDKGEMSAEQLQAWLEEEYPTQTVELSDGSSKACTIDWNAAASGFDGVTPGGYTIYGTFVPTDGTSVANPNLCRAKIEVTIPQPPVPDLKIVSIASSAIEVEQNIYLAPLSKKYELTGTPTTVTPPETVTVTLGNGTTAQLAVNWHVEDFDPYKVTAEGKAPQRIVGDLVIPEGSNITNPNNIPAYLDVTVTPMTYKVAQGKPTAIAVEVFKGSTLEEVNQQLEAEGKDEVSIIATNSRNASRKTFSKIFLSESVNADWATQKDQCGTYKLTASWPENIGMRSTTRPVVISVNVTVKEPLEIVSTKTAHMDMYPGVDPANAENIPQKVTAVLSDNSEVEVDVEWDWSFYNKNNLSNPPVLGHLKNLPKNAKQPESGEITANMALLMIPVTYTIQSQTGTSSLTAKAGLTLEEITALSQQEGSEIPALTRTFHLSGTAEDLKTVTTDYTVSFTLTGEENPDYDPTAVGSRTLTASMTLPDYIDTSTTPDYDKVTLTTEPVAISSIEPVSVIDREGTAFANLSNVPEQVRATLDVAGLDGVAKTVWLSVDWNTESYDPLPEGITEDTSVTQTVTGTLVNVPAYIQTGSAAPALSVTLGREFDILSIAPVQTGEKEVKLGTSFAEVSSMVSHEAVLSLRCTNGTTTTQTVSFELLAEDNASYDPMTVGTYTLQGRLLIGANVKNPSSLPVELTVRTAKYSIVEAYVPEEDIFMTVGEDPLDYLPATIPVLLSNDETEDITAVWDLNTIDATASDFYVVEGTFDLPVYLENPDNIQPMVFVFVDEPDSQILSMTQLTETGSGMRKAAAKQAKVIPGYTAHKYRVERLYEDGTVKEQVMTLYLKNQ